LKRNKCEKNMPIIKPNLLASIKYHARPKAIVRQIRNRLKPSATRQAQKIINTNPNVEHAMSKFPKKRITDISKDQKKDCVNADYRKLEKDINKIPEKDKLKIQIIHDHEISAIPSIKDLYFNFKAKVIGLSGSDTVYVKNEIGKIIGKTQYTIDKNKMSRNFLNKINNIMKLEQEKKSETEIYENIKSIFSDYIAAEIIQAKSENNQISKERLYLTAFIRQGLIIHFIPAKGYKFNYEKMIFEKK